MASLNEMTTLDVQGFGEEMNARECQYIPYASDDSKRLLIVAGHFVWCTAVWVRMMKRDGREGNVVGRYTSSGRR